MAAVKWIFVVVFGLGSAGALGMAFVSGGGSRTVTPRTSPPIALRQFPVLVASVGTPKAPDVAKEPEPDAAKPEPEPAQPEPVAAKAEPEAAKPEPEPVAAKPAPTAAKPAPAKPAPVAAKPPAAKPPPVAKAPEPAAKPPEPEPDPEPVAKAPAPKPPEPAAKPPEPVAAKPASSDGVINLRATDTADVYLDGKKLGGSPLLGIKAKVGNHKVRFDCYDAAGNTISGPVQVIAVKAEGEVDVEYPCPVE